MIGKIKSFGVTPVRAELSAAFRLFKKYSLIDYAEDESGEDAKIRLYPSLQFGWDVPQFRAVAREYLKEETEDKDARPEDAAQEGIKEEGVCGRPEDDFTEEEE